MLVDCHLVYGWSQPSGDCSPHLHANKSVTKLALCTLLCFNAAASQLPFQCWSVFGQVDTLMHAGTHFFVLFSGPVFTLWLLSVDRVHAPWGHPMLTAGWQHTQKSLAQVPRLVTEPWSLLCIESTGMPCFCAHALMASLPSSCGQIQPLLKWHNFLEGGS